MDKRFLLVFAIGFLLLSSCCVTEEEEELTAEQVRDRSIAAMETVETYSFDTNIDMVVEGDEAAGMGLNKVDVSMTGNGKSDIKNKKMWMKMSMSMLGMSMDIEQYIIGDTQYMKAPIFGWVKNKTSEHVWEQQSFAGMPEELLNTAVELLDDEEGCYVLKVDVDVQDMLDFMNQQMGSTSTMGSGDLDEIKEAEIREWISKDTFMVKKLFMYLKMEQDGSTMDMELTMNLYDYNEPADIVLPSEAESAVEIESMMEGMLTTE